MKDIKHLEDKYLTVTKASHDTQAANRKVKMQCNNGKETNTDYTCSQNTMNTEQIDMVVDNKVKQTHPIKMDSTTDT